MAVLLETSVGDIVVDLMLEERPKACLNFLKLCKMKVYNYCLFHTVKSNFIAQAGDPTNTGDGGTSIWGLRDGESQRFFGAEKAPRIKHAQVGMLSMVNDGSGRHSSQWFITLGADLDYLDSQEHTVFGAVSEGADALRKLNEAYCDKDGRPYRDIRINHTVVLDDPYPDLDGLNIPSRSPSPTAEQLKSSRIGADEEIDNDKGLTVEEIDEKINEQEAAAHTTMLEMVGDIPDADAKPPDNVLFVCKLNPATTSEDLETIFSRFGNIASCEVIRDQKSGESLQYAFVEFDKAEECEEAYFKMDNVLIDERRIHVDFSQSVAKIQGNPRKIGSGKAKAEFQLKSRERKGNEKYEMVFDELDTAALATAAVKSKSKSSHRDRDTESRKRPREDGSEAARAQKKQRWDDTEGREGHGHRSSAHDSRHSRADDGRDRGRHGHADTRRREDEVQQNEGRSKYEHRHDNSDSAHHKSRWDADDRHDDRHRRDDGRRRHDDRERSRFRDRSR